MGPGSADVIEPWPVINCGAYAQAKFNQVFIMALIWQFQLKIKALFNWL
jgi:hypothetical protein